MNQNKDKPRPTADMLEELFGSLLPEELFDPPPLKDDEPSEIYVCPMTIGNAPMGYIVCVQDREKPLRHHLWYLGWELV